MDRLTRLFSMVDFLTYHKKSTGKELAEKFKVSKRTIYRDIEILSTLNVPIYVKSGRNGGIYILEAYTISKSLVTNKEQQQILAALSAFEKIGASSDLLSMKLANVFSKPSLSPFNIDFSGWGKTEEKEKLDMLASSVTHKRFLHFTYTNAQKITSKRDTIVISIDFKKNAWYFKAYCLDKKEIRLFKVARLKKMNIGAEYNSSKYNSLWLRESHTTDMEYIDVTLKVKTASLTRLQEELPVKNTELLNEEYSSVTIKQPQGKWLINYLLSFGSLLEVISPASLRLAIIDEIKKMKNNY